MRLALTALAVGCARPVPTGVLPIAPCVDRPDDAPAPGYPVQLDLSEDPTAREAAFRAETGRSWSFVQVDRDGLVRRATLPASVADTGAADALLRDLARYAGLFGVAHPEALADCAIVGDAERTMTVSGRYDGHPIGAFTMAWVPAQGVVQVHSSLLPQLVGPAPIVLSDDALTTLLLEQLGEQSWRLQAEPEQPHPCDCADRECRACAEYGRRIAAAWFEPIDREVELVPEHVRWTRFLGRFAAPTEDGPDELRLAAVATLVPRPGEIPEPALGRVRFASPGTGPPFQRDAVTGEDLTARRLVEMHGW